MNDFEVPLSEEITASLLQAMNLTEVLSRPPRAGRPHGFVEMLVGQIDGLKVHLQFNEHPPPHFSVRCSEGVARFRIDDGARLAPDRDLKKYDRDIRKWHGRNRRYLAIEWNASRPTDCTVGPVVVPEQNNEN